MASTLSFSSIGKDNVHQRQYYQSELLPKSNGGGEKKRQTSHIFEVTGGEADISVAETAKLNKNDLPPRALLCNIRVLFQKYCG